MSISDVMCRTTSVEHLTSFLACTRLIKFTVVLERSACHALTCKYRLFSQVFEILLFCHYKLSKISELISIVNIWKSGQEHSFESKKLSLWDIVKYFWGCKGLMLRRCCVFLRFLSRTFAEQDMMFLSNGPPAADHGGGSSCCENPGKTLIW